MTAIDDRPAAPVGGVAALDRAAGLELLGPVQGTGYTKGAALVRRADGQVVQLSPMLYALLESVDSARRPEELAAATGQRIGRQLGPPQVEALARKLAALGLLAGTEHLAPPKRNPLLALRWKVLVTNPEITRRLTAPFGWLFAPWVMWPVLAAFGGVCWFVLVDKGVAAATRQAFDRPGLLLLVFALTVASAGFHEFGHAAVCRRGGATPGGMGMGLYLVWPAFYTDVTDAYRLPRRDRLRVDLAGLYFNALVAVATMAFWLVWRTDALLLLVALQLLQMVKQLSPIVRADGYHILADATGVPDLFAHIGPTMRRLLPGRRPPSALSGRARLLVTAWVLVVVPVLLSLMASAVLLLPRLVTTAVDSGRHIAGRIPAQAGGGDVLGVLAALLQLVALAIPVAASALVTAKLARTSVRRAVAWSRGSLARQAVSVLVGVGVVAGVAWAWWPAGQYQPVRADQQGTLPALGRALGDPGGLIRPAGAVRTALPQGTRLAVAMVPEGGATRSHPALLVVPGAPGRPATALVITDGPAVGPDGHAKATLTGTAFPFVIPPVDARPGDSQALAVNTGDGAVLYDIAYSLVTVDGTGPVTNRNSAFALASCRGCTTVAVSFQVVLVVGHHDVVAPIDASGALNETCPACATTALADQLVVTLRTAPSAALVDQLTTDLRQLDALPALGAGADPSAIAASVSAVQAQIDAQLQASGDLASAASGATTTTTAPMGATTASSTSTTTEASGEPGSTTSGTTETSGDGGSTTATTSASTSSGSATPTTSSTTQASTATTATTASTVGSSTTTADGSTTTTSP
ncbi:MAG TPA: hypothetical protein VFP61_08745 [Acidimicrobiales bacterium]|nr:hypothetical protein [Acidimicrobiales bacterium]